MESASIRLRIAPHRIFFLKFILEGYDNLALLSTIDQTKGLVELFFSPGDQIMVEMLLRDLASDIGLQLSLV